ncbi:MAG: hypothetical protein ACT4OG_07740, partial [Alphaproteobacteria bacterium]
SLGASIVLTLLGLGLDLMGNTLAMVWPGASPLIWEILFYASILWLLWIALGLLYGIPPWGNRTRLEVIGPRPYQDRQSIKHSYRIVVHNVGPNAAEHVRVRVCEATAPQNRSREDDLPYDVTMVGAEWHVELGGQRTIQTQDAHIIAGEEQRYVIADTWLPGAMPNGLFVVDKIDTRNNRENSRFIARGERWRLRYEVTAENAAPIVFFIEIFVEGDVVIAQRAQ